MLGAVIRDDRRAIVIGAEVETRAGILLDIDLVGETPDLPPRICSLIGNALTNHISWRCDISKATKVQSWFAAVQQPQQLNQNATLMGYIYENAIADQVRSRSFGFDGRAC